MRKSAMIIINPSAGKEKAASYEDVVKKELGNKYTDIVVKYTKGEGDATKFAVNAAKNKFDLVVSLGGDGTVNETVNGLVRFDIPPRLGIIPLGTVNMLARVLNIPTNANKAIELLSNDYYKEIDVGLANDKYFTNVLAIGEAAKAVYDVDVEEKTKFGFIAYIRAVVEKIMDDDIFPVKLKMDTEEWEGKVAVVVIGLLDSLIGFKSLLSNDDINNGIMHVVAIKSLNIPKLIGMTPALALGKMKDSDNFEYFQTKTLEVETLSNVKQMSNIDGDEGPELPIKIKVLPRHLKIISKE